jgi:hypothetical protein
MTDSTEPPPLTQFQMNQFVMLSALPTLAPALAPAESRLRWLEAELAALKAQADPLNDAVEEACGELPSGWMVLISLERGAGWVDLIYPDGRMHEVHEDETKVADLVREAIRMVKEGER